MNTENKSVILFDGVCNLCNASVNFVLKNDTKKHFVFASLQSDVAKQLLLHHKLKKNDNILDSIVLINNDTVHKKSTAALLIAKKLRFPYSFLSVFLIIPPFIRDFIYDIIAKYRYSWFGKKPTCRIPTKAEKERFLG